MIFLRHPKPKVAPGTCYGRLDIDLTESAAAEIASALKRLPVASRVISSPAQRCQRLARAIARFHDVDLVTDRRLQELDFGAWEGRLWSEIDRAESDSWAADPWSVAPPDGETFADLHGRTTAALGEIGAGAIVVTHAGVIRAAAMILTGASYAQVFATRIPYAEPLTLSRKDTRWRA